MLVELPFPSDSSPFLISCKKNLMTASLSLKSGSLIGSFLEHFRAFSLLALNFFLKFGSDRLFLSKYQHQARKMTPNVVTQAVDLLALAEATTSPKMPVIPKFLPPKKRSLRSWKNQFVVASSVRPLSRPRCERKSRNHMMIDTEWRGHVKKVQFSHFRPQEWSRQSHKSKPIFS